MFLRYARVVSEEFDRTSLSQECIHSFEVIELGPVKFFQSAIHSAHKIISRLQTNTSKDY